VKTVMNLWVPQNIGNFLISLATVSVSVRTLLYGINYGRAIILWSFKSALRLSATKQQLRTVTFWPGTFPVPLLASESPAVRHHSRTYWYAFVAATSLQLYSLMLGVQMKRADVNATFLFLSWGFLHHTLGVQGSSDCGTSVVSNTV
jgi:hypothetical protein